MRDEIKYKIEVEQPLRGLIEEVRLDVAEVGGVQDDEFYRTLYVIALEHVLFSGNPTWIKDEVTRIVSDRPLPTAPDVSTQSEYTSHAAPDVYPYRVN